MKFKIRQIGKNKKRIKKTAKKLPHAVPDKYKNVLKYAGLTVGTIALMMLVYFSEQAGVWFKASVLEAPQAFNGTALPVDKVPNWTKVGGKTRLKYNQIPVGDFIKLPKYNLNTLQFPSDSLIWGNSNHDIIRNAKITYSVVYMGNYKLDHKEDVGSHLAVDIKLPEGTPIRSIANGKVVKKSMISNGFGHHIVIKHPNVPDPGNPGKRVTLYSAFNHMDQINVSEGQNVLKGQIIGTSGNTGTSSTPHLHFQIDRESAGWHPYWPFSWKDSRAAGLSFFEAVNAGLGLSNGKTHTVHPMDFVYKNLNYKPTVNNNATTKPADNTDKYTLPKNEESTSTTTTTTTTNPTPPVTTPPPVTTEPKVNFADGSASKLFTYTITGETLSYINNGVTLTVKDETNQVSKLKSGEYINLEISGVGNLLKKNFSKTDFIDGTIKLIVKSSKVGTANITVGKSSHQVNFIDKVKPVAKLLIKHDGHFQKNIVEKMQVIALDADGNVAPAVNFMGVVSVKSNKIGSAKITPNRLESRDFKNGIADLRVIISDKGPITIKANNGAIVGTGNPIYIEDTQIFSDISRSHKNYEAIKYLKNKSIINGYSDGSFKPTKTVNRAEALKMLMLAFDVKENGNGILSFSDVDINAWYASALSAALSKGIVQGYSDGTFKPSKTVNRAEYLKILFATNNMKPTNNITKPYNDVKLTDWFAGYAFMANKMNILDTSNNLNPTNGMTRADVAETIYRMKMIKDNNLVTYSK